MFKELFAVCLLVEDFDKSVDFYKNKIGLDLNNLNGKFADFKLNGTSLAIFEKNEAQNMVSLRYMNKGGSCVLSFQVDNIEKFIDKIQSENIQIFEGPKITSWGQKVAYFLDPDQNIWEISEK